MKNEIILEYEKAPLYVRDRLIPIKELEPNQRNTIYQTIVAISTKRIKNTDKYFGVLYIKSDIPKGRSRYFFDKKKYTENIEKIETEQYKRDELIGIVNERLKSCIGAKIEISKVLAENGFAKNAKSAIQHFYYGGSLKEAQFIYDYVKNKYGI